MKSNQLLRFIICLFLTAFFSFFYYRLYGQPATGIDDADIYFVYIKHFVEGNGFVYNDGGERVEGFTSLLWVLLLSPLYLFFENFEKAILVLNIAIISFTVFRTINFLDTLTGSKNIISVQSLIIFVYIYIIPGFIDWTVLSLMESSLWCFLLTMIVIDIGYYVLSKRKESFTLICVYVFLLVLTRPESLLWGLFFCAMLGLTHFYVFKSKSAALKRLIGVLSLFSITVIVLVSFRMLYFGYPLPNTYYAKVSSGIFHNVLNGLHYFIFSTWQTPFLWVFFISSCIALLIIFRSLKDRKRILELSHIQVIQLIVSATSIVSFLIPICLGGDHFELLRFFQPFMLIYLLCLLNTTFWKNHFGEISFKIRSLSSSYIFVFLLFPFLYFVTRTPLHYIRKGRSPIYGEFKIATIGREEGRVLNNFFSRLNEKPSVGVSAAGGFAYTYQGVTVDLLGLNNTQMAHASTEKRGIKNHAAFDVATFYEIAPDIFHGYTHGSKVLSKFLTSPENVTLDFEDSDFEDSFVNKLFKGIFSTEEFNVTYAPVIIYNPDVPQFYYQTFVHVDYLPVLREYGYEVVTLKQTKL